MADPEVIKCDADAWTKVATDVTTGNIWILNTSPDAYLQTYRDTGEDAPSDNSDAVSVSDRSIPIAAEAGIDVYIKAVGKDGQVRVDL